MLQGFYMFSFNNLSFRIKLMIPISIIAGLFALMSISTIAMLAAIEKDSQHIAQAYLPTQTLLLKADTDLHQAMLAEKSIIAVTASSQTEHQELFDNYVKNIAQAAERVPSYRDLIELELAPNLNNEISKYLELSQKWQQSTSEYFKNPSEHDVDTLIQASLTNEVVFEQMRDIVDVLLNATLAASKDSVTHAANEINYNQTISYLGLALGLSLCLLIIIFFPGLITSRLNLFLSQIKNIAKGNGDLTARLSIDSKDEIGQIAIEFDHFIEKLQTLLVNVINIAQQLTDAQQQMSQHASDANAAMLEQQHEVTAISQSINEMAQAALEIANSAERAATNANDSNSATQQGLSVVDTTKESIYALATQMGQASDVIKSLQENCLEIGSVVDVINNIAEQTNLLALNAAIEAARAGEQGRGFAVVADEVRTLAGRTQQSTTEIHAMVQQLQKISAQAVQAIIDSGQQTEGAVNHTDNTGVALHQIATSVSQISDINTSVAFASHQQTDVTSALSENMNRINLQINTLARSTELTSQCCQDIDSMNQALQQQLANFKV